jgi:DNA-binding CsgD family transcriptional regulator
MQLATDAQPIALEVAQIAASPGSTTERADALLDPLHRIFPFDGVWLAVRDEQRRGHRSVISRGWDQRVAEFLDGPTVVDEIERLDMDRFTTAMRVADLPIPPEELVGWADYLLPAGFREGIGLSLFSDGRCVGFLGLLTGDRTMPSDDIRDLLLGLAPIIAQAIDPFRSLAIAARFVRDATAGVLLTRSGDVVPIPGLPCHQLLASGSSVVAAARHMAPGAPSSFLVPYAPVIDRYLRITVMPAPDGGNGAFAAILTVSDCCDRRGLTQRELEILGLMISGWPDLRIAHVLQLAESAVPSHVDHILVKLAADSRALAAARAQRYGLYIPSELVRKATCEGTPLW